MQVIDDAGGSGAGRYAVASRAIRAGELVLAARPLVCLPLVEHLRQGDYCLGCLRKVPTTASVASGASSSATALSSSATSSSLSVRCATCNSIFCCEPCARRHATFHTRTGECSVIRTFLLGEQCGNNNTNYSGKSRHNPFAGMKSTDADDLLITAALLARASAEGYQFPTQREQERVHQAERKSCLQAELQQQQQHTQSQKQQLQQQQQPTPKKQNVAQCEDDSNSSTDSDSSESDGDVENDVAEIAATKASQSKQLQPSSSSSTKQQRQQQQKQKKTKKQLEKQKREEAAARIARQRGILAECSVGSVVAAAAVVVAAPTATATTTSQQQTSDVESAMSEQKEQQEQQLLQPQTKPLLQVISKGLAADIQLVQTHKRTCIESLFAEEFGNSCASSSSASSSSSSSLSAARAARLLLAFDPHVDEGFNVEHSDHDDVHLARTVTSKQDQAFLRKVAALDADTRMKALIGSDDNDCFASFCRLISNADILRKTDAASYETRRRKYCSVVDRAAAGTASSSTTSTSSSIKGDAWIHATRGIGSDFFRHLCSTLRENAFGIYAGVGGSKSVGLAVYPVASFFNHSCCRNLIRRPVGRSMVFYAARDIAQGEALTISYVAGFDTASACREFLLEEYRFWCRCAKCEGGLSSSSSSSIVEAASASSSASTATVKICSE